MALIKGPPNFVGSLVEWWKPCPLVVVVYEGVAIVGPLLHPDARWISEV